jgi:probable F420-dependent oxidoreductase
MAMAAEATSTLRVGCRVLCIDYHQPVVLAKELATLDLLSGGRLEIGLGAGWLSREYDAMGIAFDRPGVRLDRLGEVLDLMDACFGGEQVEIHGKWVQASGFQAVPAPIQRPRPPIMIGGGSPRILKMAGARADVVSLNFDNSSGRIGREGVSSSTAEQTVARIGWIREGAGGRFAGLELETAAYFTAVTDDPAAVLDSLAIRLEVPAEELAAHPNVLVGPVPRLCEVLQQRREQYGINYITVGAAVMESFAPVVAALAGA